MIELKLSELLDIPVFQNVKDKVDSINELAESENLNLKSVLYIGNDLNDLQAINLDIYNLHNKDIELIKFLFNRNINKYKEEYKN